MKLNELLEADITPLRDRPIKPTTALAFSMARDGIRVTPRNVADRANIPEGTEMGVYFRESPDGRLELVAIDMNYQKALANIRKGLRRVPKDYNIGNQEEMDSDDLEIALDELDSFEKIA
jgi:hypothetical protein